MAVNDLVSDPKLSVVLQTSGYAQDQAAKLLQLLTEVSAAGEALTPELQAGLSKEQKLLLTNISHLRGLHRAANFTARETKAQTAEARHEVDRLHLQLQNLYYEQRHLEGEIEACESYEYVAATNPLNQSLLTANRAAILTRSFPSSPSRSSSRSSPSTPTPTRTPS